MTLAEFMGMESVSVADLAERMGVSRTTLYRWASGGCEPSASHALKLEEVTVGAVPVSSWSKQKRASA